MSRKIWNDQEWRFKDSGDVYRHMFNVLHSHKELRKTWLARSIPSSDSSWQPHKHKSKFCHSTTCTVYKLNKFPHSCWPTYTCNNTCITAAESDYTVTLSCGYINQVTLSKQVQLTWVQCRKFKESWQFASNLTIYQRYGVLMKNMTIT